MTFSLEQLVIAYSDQLWLEFSPSEQEAAWPPDRDYSHDAARWRAYLNRLCLNILVPELQQEDPLKNLPQEWPNPATLPSIWEVLNGTAITLGSHRIVIIPDTSIDTEEFCVPAEWVDIPSFAADYYLAVQVNDYDGWLRVWGFTTHQKLKHEGTYDPSDRTYSLSAEDLFENLNVLWVAKELCPEPKAEIQPLPKLSSTQAQRLLAKLGQQSPYSPLEVSFEDWKSLLASDEWRQELYNRRVAPSKKSVELRQWLRHVVGLGQNLVKDGWQTYEDMFGSPEPIPFRSSRGSEHTSPDAIASVIRLLQPNQPEQIRCQATGVLGEIAVGNPDAINALIELLQSAKNVETRWQAALSLGKVDPGNPQAGISKVKSFDLGMQLGGIAVDLIVAIMPKANERIGVIVRVQPQHSGTKLPSNLKLNLLTKLGETLQEVEARSDLKGRGKDDFIQLSFNLPLGTHFCIRVKRDNVSVTENFVA